MRIRRVVIRNFRCLQDVEIAFDDVTTFVGPNGVGKSSILRALDWFFNSARGSHGLSSSDCFLGQSDSPISVSVEFSDLSTADRDRLGKFAPPGQETVLIAKQWENGVERTIGRSRVFPPFEDVRSRPTATDRRSAYKSLREERSDLDLAAWTNDAATADAMSQWEADHTDLLEESDVESSSPFFGFAGQARMSGLFDFIFVSADMRAAEEVLDSRAAVIGRILEQAVDRSGADSELADLLEAASRTQQEIQTRYFGEQLESLSSDLTEAVSALATGRSLRVTSEAGRIQQPKIQFRVNVLDQEFETPVDRQGHGFQRAMLIAALKLLAERGHVADQSSVMCLAIEEPELYQHPLQARSFAVVLRALAEDSDTGVQVAYATHSPYFIEARSFHQIRRVTRETQSGNVRVAVVGSTVERVIDRLAGFVEPEKVQRQLDSVCMGGLGEGFFADVVLLVEGSTERAILSGVAARESAPLLLEGIFVGEAGGKTGLLLPYVILQELGIPAYVVADNDSHLRDEVGSTTDDIRARKLASSVSDSIAWNRRLLRFFGLAEEDWPVGPVAQNLTFVDGGLEQALDDMWPAWAESRQDLIDSGAGFSGKDRATYEEAALCAEGAVPTELRQLIANAKALRDVA